MVCPKCGHEMSADSEFCMNCGNKVPKLELELKKDERNKTKINRKMIFSILAVCIVVTIACGVGYFHQKNLKSPIEGVSQKVYVQGMEYLDTMETTPVKNLTMKYISAHKEEKLDELYAQVEGVDFKIELGKKPTEEELYFAEVIDKFWESWVICYGHESVISEYKDSDAQAIQMFASMYKGIVSTFEDEIAEAKSMLKSANDYSDMQEVYATLENLWNEENEEAEE